MKHKIILIIALIIVSLLVSCKAEENMVISDSGVKGMYEWVSPDGVHYWVYSSIYQGAMSPRYDNNGNLVIDKK